MLQLFYDQNMLGRKKTIPEKPWQKMLHNKTIKNQKLPPFGKLVTEVLIFRSSYSQMFFKIGVLKNFDILEPLSNKVAGLLLQSNYGSCFWIFAAENTFFS